MTSPRRRRWQPAPTMPPRSARTRASPARSGERQACGVVWGRSAGTTTARPPARRATDRCLRRSCARPASAGWLFGSSASARSRHSILRDKSPTSWLISQPRAETVGRVLNQGPTEQTEGRCKIPAPGGLLGSGEGVAGINSWSPSSLFQRSIPTRCRRYHRWVGVTTILPDSSALAIMSREGVPISSGIDSIRGSSPRQQGTLRFIVADFSPAGEKSTTGGIGVSAPAVVLSSFAIRAKNRQQKDGS